MSSRSDPVEEASPEGRDLYDIATWEERTSLDGLAVAVYWLITRLTKFLVLFTAFLILVAILASFGFGLVFDPVVAGLVGMSAIPALGLAAYVYVSDVTTREPLSLLVATFLLSVLTATFAAVFNSVAQPFFEPLGYLGIVLFFFIIVGPVEETVKLLAVRLYAYTDDRFDAVIDGAVYGAIAGLGFVVIENFVYIAGNVDIDELRLSASVIGAGDGIAAIRALAGPGHVIYSAFAGYYLGLAKFNPEHRGPIIVKGLLIAATIHALYNSLVGPATTAISSLTGLSMVPALFVFVVVFQGFFGYILLLKIWRYRDAYLSTRPDPDGSGETAATAATEPGVEPSADSSLDGFESTDAESIDSENERSERRGPD